MSDEPITKDWIRYNAGSIFSGHIKCEGSSIYSRTVVNRHTNNPIGLTYADQYFKHRKSNGALAGKTVRTWHVGNQSFEGDIQPALDALNAQRAEEPA